MHRLCIESISPQTALIFIIKKKKNYKQKVGLYLEI